MQASETRLGRRRANQFVSCPKLPTNTKATPLSLAQDFSSRSMLIILDSRSDAGSAVLVIFVRRRLGMKGSFVHFAPPFQCHLMISPRFYSTYAAIVRCVMASDSSDYASRLSRDGLSSACG